MINKARKSNYLRAHRENKLTPFSKSWWKSLYRIYFYDYITTDNKYSGEMFSFCQRKISQK